MASKSTEITRAFWALGDYFSRLGGSARYRNMEESEIPLYIGCQLAAKCSPPFATRDYIAPVFLEAAAPVLKEVHSHLDAVTNRPKELAVLLHEFVAYANSKLRPDDRSRGWDRFSEWVNQSPAIGIASVSSAKRGGNRMREIAPNKQTPNNALHQTKRARSGRRVPPAAGR